MELENVIENEVRQRRRNNVWHPLFVESKMKLYNKLTKHKHELMFARGQDGRKGLLDQKSTTQRYPGYQKNTNKKIPF